MNNIDELVKQIFHPEPYGEIEDNLEGTSLHLSRTSVNSCKYVLLVGHISKDTSLKELIKQHKKSLKKYYNAKIAKGVGVIEIFFGKEADWLDKTSSVKPDWHGLQSVILQGVLFVDPESQKHELLQSQWGPIKFGNFQGQMDKVHYLLGKLNA